MILRLEPDFSVLELNMPRVSGLDVIRRVRRENCETKLIVLSSCRDQSAIRELFQSGADGYLLKDGPAGQLFDAIRCILDGGQYLTPLISPESIDNKRKTMHSLALLSKREYEVFSLLADGKRPEKTSREIVGDKPKNRGYLSGGYYA